MSRWSVMKPSSVSGETYSARCPGRPPATRTLATLPGMAVDMGVDMGIVPIQLSLTAGELITLWAPPREGGEEWEGFLGDGQAVHVFPDAPALAAYVRTVSEHYLDDHPNWPWVRRVSVPELVPFGDRCYDPFRVPRLLAEGPAPWNVLELAGITTLLRSLANTRGLPEVHQVLDEGFVRLPQGVRVFEVDRTWLSRRADHSGDSMLWDWLDEAITPRWPEVIDTLDRAVAVPTLDPDALEIARRELHAAGGGGLPARDLRAPPPPPDSEAEKFWASMGIDPIVVTMDSPFGARVWHCTLRGQVGDRPVFLGRDGRIVGLDSTWALAAYLGSGHDQNFTGLGEDLAYYGSARMDNLDAAVELMVEVGQWAQDRSVEIRLNRGQRLGRLVSSVPRRRPHPPTFDERYGPGRVRPTYPPYEAEAQHWNQLVEHTLSRFHRP